MNNTLFYKSFGFRLLSITRNYRHTDNSQGIENHFFARMVKGSAEIVTIDGERIKIKEGDIFYLPINLRYHSYWYGREGEDDDERKIIWESYAFKFFPDRSDKRYKMQKIDADGDTVKYLDVLAESLSVSCGTVSALYSFLERVLPNMEEDRTDVKTSLMTKAKQYISETPELKVPELAKYCNMSESGIYAFFKKHAQMTPIEMKNKMRAEDAVRLLETTDMSIEEISTRLGYNTSSYFRKIIKEYTGSTPLKIRKEAKNI